MLTDTIRKDLGDTVGKFSLIERELNLNADRKLQWFERIESIDSRMMNESVPLSLNLLTKNMI